jgi:hypothetical protein
MPRLRTVVITLAVALVAAGVGYSVGRARPSVRSEHVTPSTSASVVHLVKSGGVYMADTGIDLSGVPPEDLPYPYDGRTPPDRATPIDGAYLRNLALGPLGGPTVGLPLHCLRCIPYRLDAGISTLILYHGRYFLDHLLSDFRAEGFYVVHDDRIVFTDDPNCSSSRGVYRWTRAGEHLRFQVIHDPCPFDQLRSQDLMAIPWTAFDHCLMRVEGLWPGELGCRGRHFRP